MPDVYLLNRLADLLNVPRSLRIRAVSEVLKTLEAAEDYHALVKALAERSGFEVRPTPDLGPIEWCEDQDDSVRLVIRSEISR